MAMGGTDSGPTDTEPEAFARLLSLHVYSDINISYPAPLSGCWASEKANEPLRSIGYVLEILQRHEKEWKRRREAIYQIGYTVQRLREAILEEGPKLKREQAVIAHERALNAVLSLRSWLQRDVEQVVTAQERGRKAYQEAEAAMATLVEHQRQLEDARARLDEATAAARALGIER